MSDRGVRAVTLGDGRVDQLAVEEPLEIRVDGKPLAVLMRTPGEDRALVAGFLATEGLIDGPDDLSGLAPCGDPMRPRGENVMLAQLAAGVRAGPERFERARRDLYAVSSCGLCGKASIERVFQLAPPLEDRVTLDAAQVQGALDALAGAQPRFRATGGLHGAILLSPSGALLAAAEDVGRHNAVDKVIGARLLADAYPLEGTVLAVSSRAGFEIVQKAVVARVSALVAVGASSSLAHELAVEAGLALYSFARDGRFNAHQT